MAKLKFFFGAMRAGKSTFALQMNHSFKLGNRKGVLITAHDRSGRPVISSRIGIEHEALSINKLTNLYELIEGKGYDYVICDEVQFYTIEQIEQLSDVVDELGIDVFCFGITTDFQTNLFNPIKRLFELADEKEEIPIKSLCWCGAKAIINARTVDGILTTEGEQEYVGDVGFIGYETLCRRHYKQQLTERVARARGLV